MNATLIEQPVSKSRQRQPASISAANKAWVAKVPKQPMALARQANQSSRHHRHRWAGSHGREVRRRVRLRRDCVHVERE